MRSAVGNDFKPRANERPHEGTSASAELKVQLVTDGTDLLEPICVDCLRPFAL